MSTPVNNLNILADDNEELSVYYELDAQLAILIDLLQLAPRPSGSKTLTVNNANLYRIALDEYGDATMWNFIAEANGLDDPEIQGTVVLTIPPKPAKSNGGIYDN